MASRLFNRLRRGKFAPKADSSSSNNNGIENGSIDALLLRDIMDLCQGYRSESNFAPNAFNFARKMYTNSCWPSDLPWISYQEQSDSIFQMDLLMIAAKSCLELQSDPELGQRVEIQIGGTAKEWDLSMKFKIDDVGADESRVIVVALLASQPNLDWLVSHEFETVPTEGLTGIEELKVHEGVLEATKKVISPIADALREHLAKHPVQYQAKRPRLLLCGYSTGGAVASLVWRYLASMIQAIREGTWRRSPGPNSPKESIMVHFDSAHCRTFGVPPVFSQPLFSVKPQPGQSASTIITFINEGDPIPRLDILYLRNLICLAVGMVALVGRTRSKLPTSGWLHSLPSRLRFDAASVIGFRLLQERPNHTFDDVCAVVAEGPLMEKSLSIDFTQHPMQRYYRNVQSWFLQDAHKLTKHKIQLTLTKDVWGNSGVGIDGALQVVGFDPWFYAGDLGSFREWRVSGMTSDGWDIQVIGFDYPYLHQMVHLLESRHVATDKTMYVCPFNGHECDATCKTCALFQSQSVAASLVSDETVQVGTAEDLGVMERLGCQLSGFIARVLRSQNFHPKTHITTKIKCQSGMLKTLTFEASEDPVAYREDDTVRVEVLGLHRTMSIELGLYGNWNSEMQGLSIQAPCQSDVARSANFETFQRWIKDCKTHEKCASIVLVSPPLPTRVIDVAPGLKPGLVRLYESHGATGEYVALSYVWGGDQIKTKLDLLEEFKESIRLDSLPKTIQDAIAVTQKLGIRYLWVDSLCIIQDCDEDMQQEITKMAQIYKSATLTVSAATATSCHQGFLHPRQEISQRLGLSFPIKLARLDSVDNTHSRDGGSIFACPDVSLGHELIPIADEPIESRAWTMQEAWLSPRILMFVSGSPRWICLTTDQEVGGWKDQDVFYYPRFQGRERILAKDTQGSLYPGIDKVLAQQLRPLAISDETRSLRTLDNAMSFSRTAESIVEESLIDKLEQWQHLVSRYTSRSLTMPCDKLPAISAIASEFKRWLDTRYLAGLWECNLVRDLLWYQTPLAGDERTKRPPSYRAPSWSWASIDGEVKFDAFSMDYNARTKVVIHECQTTTLFESNPFGQVESGGLILTAPIRGMSRESVLDRFVITTSRKGSYFSDYIVPDILSNNPDFQDLPDGNEAKHGLYSARPTFFLAAGSPPIYENYDKAESKPADHGQTILQPGLPNVLLQTNGVSSQASTDDFWFLELARSDGPRGLVLIRNKNGTFRRTGYFRLGRTQHGDSGALNELNPAGPRGWEWAEGLEMKTVKIE